MTSITDKTKSTKKGKWTKNNPNIISNHAPVSVGKAVHETVTS